MTLQELELAVFDAVGGLGDAPDDAVVRRVRRSINAWHTRFLSRPGMEKLRDDVYALTSTDGTAEYALPVTLAQIRGIHQRSSTQYLEEWSLDYLRQADPGLTNTGGISRAWVPMGTRAVAVQPSNASAIYVKSSSASDVSIAYLTGSRTGGYPCESSVTMTGATAVQFGSLSDVIQIDSFHLSSPAIGTVTLHEDSGSGTTLATIPIAESATRYFWIRLWPTPDGDTYHIDYTRALGELRQPRAEPLLPPDFHDLLVDGPVHDEWVRRGDLPQANQILARMQQREAELKHFVLNPPSYRPVIGTLSPGGSNLGGYYPAGYW